MLIRTITASVITLGVVINAWAELDQDNLQEHLQDIAPEIVIESVNDTPIDGIYEVTASGTIMYATEDGDYLFYGDLLDLDAGGVNLSEVARANVRLELIEAVDPNSFITIGPEDPEHTVIVFTDIDCSYCLQLHREVPELNEMGIAVKYAAFPRAGVGSDSYDKIVQVWCADDQGEAMGLALSGKMRSVKECKSSGKFEDIVKRHLQLVDDLRLTGTPAIIFENGALMPGYMPAEALAQQAELNQA